MRHVEVVPGRRLVRPLMVVAALAAAVAGCTQMEDQAVSATAAAAPPPASQFQGSKFQGSVSSVDADGGTFVVAVRIEWTPVLEARAHDRRVLVDGGTQWEPDVLRLSDVRVGEEIQVDADPAGDDWRALKVQLFDIE